MSLGIQAYTCRGNTFCMRSFLENNFLSLDTGCRLQGCGKICGIGHSRAGKEEKQAGGNAKNPIANKGFHPTSPLPESPILTIGYASSVTKKLHSSVTVKLSLHYNTMTN